MSKMDLLINDLEQLIAQAKVSGEYALLIQSIPSLKDRTVFDALTSVPDIIIIEYPTLYQVKKQLKEKFSEQKNAFFNIQKNHLEKITEYLSLNYFNSGEVDTVFVRDENADISTYMSSFEQLTAMIPSVYKNKVGKINIYLSENYNSSFASYDKNNKSINLSLKSKPDHFLSEIGHEYGHLIESFNPSIKSAALDFLKSRISENKVISLAQAYHNIDHENDMISPNTDIMVHEGSFIDPYVGRSYGPLKNDPPTEVISIGLQSLFLDPVVFLFKDVGHFKVIYKLLKGNY